MQWQYVEDEEEDWVCDIRVSVSWKSSDSSNANGTMSVQMNSLLFSFESARVLFMRMLCWRRRTIRPP